MIRKRVPDDGEVDLTLWADGGTIGGSPGAGVYWSIGNSKHGVVRYRDDSGKRKHSDEAEYLALRAALQMLLQVCGKGEVARVRVDCRPVVWHIHNSRKPRNRRLRSLYWDVKELLRRLDSNGVDVVLEWVSRKEMVDLFGH